MITAGGIIGAALIVAFLFLMSIVFLTLIQYVVQEVTARLGIAKKDVETEVKIDEYDCS